MISPTFPDVAVLQIIPQFIKRAQEVEVSQTLEEFEAFLIEIIKSDNRST